MDMLVAKIKETDVYLEFKQTKIFYLIQSKNKWAILNIGGLHGNLVKLNVSV